MVIEQYAAAVAVALSFALDRVFAEPPERAHPVVWLGKVIAPFDRAWTYPRLVGGLVALCLPLGTAVAVAGLAVAAGRVHPAALVVVAGVTLFCTTSLRMLLAEGRTVIEETETDLSAARHDLRALAGRDASTLSPGEVRSAAVESLAENLADGLVAPLLAFFLVAPTSLPGAAGAAAWVKAVNTLDSMLGYPAKPHGTASARLDDLVMWVPARLSAGLIALADGSPDAVLRAREWVDEPPSPNSGWPMATVAAAIGAKLEKPGVYVLNPIGTLPDVHQARRATKLVSRAGVIAYVTVAVWLVARAVEVIAWP